MLPAPDFPVDVPVQPSVQQGEKGQRVVVREGYQVLDQGGHRRVRLALAQIGGEQYGLVRRVADRQGPMGGVQDQSEGIGHQGLHGEAGDDRETPGLALEPEARCQVAGGVQHFGAQGGCWIHQQRVAQLPKAAVRTRTQTHRLRRKGHRLTIAVAG